MLKAVKVCDLAKQYSAQFGCSATEAKKVINNVLAVVKENLQNEGDKVMFTNLFILEVVKRKERVRFNVNTGQTVSREPYTTLKITPSKNFRVKLNSTL